MDSFLEARKIGNSKVLNFDASISKGTNLVVLGGANSGKTELVNLITGFQNLGLGTLYVLGMNIVENKKKIKNSIGIVAQQSTLDPDLSVFENLMIHASFYDLAANDLPKTIRRVLRSLQVEGCSRLYPHQLSRLIVRKIEFAKALITNPQMLILDEPTYGLSQIDKVWIWDFFSKMKREGMPMLTTTRDPLEAKALGDNITLFDKGQMLATGRPLEMIYENIGREVIEFDTDSSDIEYHLKNIRNQYEYQLFNNKVRLFVPENIEGRQVLKSINSEKITLRKAQLEDVFLKLAGYEFNSWNGLEPL